VVAEIDMQDCPECGASPQRGLTCRQQWDELLALEFSDPVAAPVHVLTVASYQLQHPRTFPLNDEARRQLRELLEDVVIHGRPVGAVRDAMQRRFDGPARVRTRADDAVAPRRVAWSMTVSQVGGADPDTHAANVRRWAASVCRESAC
jgi:hypothetical protein